MYKCLNGVAPQYLCKLLHFYGKDRDLRSADDKTLLETHKFELNLVKGLSITMHLRSGIPCPEMYCQANQLTPSRKKLSLVCLV